ncbi:MAG: carbohydrate kinase family protein [bacterium]|nr:carbohydrate kinase family protein [bacterium]
MHDYARRIALLGTVNRDTILTPDGVRTESYGGMLYSVLSLAEISEAEVYPVCNVGQDVEGAVRRFLTHPAVRMDGVSIVPEQNPHCLLEYDSTGQKQETLNGEVPPISFAQVEPFLDFDAVCVNFITGTEMALETLQAVRRETRALIFMDVHSLTLGMDENRRRFFRVPSQWEAWLGCADVVQMNEREGALLAGEPLDGAATARFGSQVLSLGPKVLLITRGSSGSEAVVCRSGEVQVLKFDAESPGSPQDETGCGDVFMMGFTWAYLQAEDVVQASRFANRVAGINCCLRGIEQVGQIGLALRGEDRFVVSQN